MSSTNLYRLSGISLLIGGTFAVVGAILGIFSSDPASPISITGAMFGFVGGTFLLLGLPGLYARQALRTGLLGLIGTALMIVYILILGTFGSALNALILPFITTQAPALANSSPPGLDLFFTSAGVVGVVGGILLGISTMRASILPRWAGVPLIVGVLLQFAGDLLQSPLANFGFLLVMIGFIWLGSAMWSRRQYAEVHPEFSSSSALV